MSRPYDPRTGFTTVNEYERHHYPSRRKHKRKGNGYSCLSCGGRVKIKGSSAMIIGEELYTSYYIKCRECGFSPVFCDAGNGRQYRPGKKLARGKVLRNWKRFIAQGHFKLALALSNAALKKEIESHQEVL